MATITLDQGDDGRLLLHREGDHTVWVINGRGRRFQEDALLLTTGRLDRAHQTVVHGLTNTSATFDGYERIVLWRGPQDWDIVAMPNAFAAEYLGLTLDEIRERLVGRSEGRPPVYLEARQRLNVEVSGILRGELDSLARERGMSRTALVERLIIEGVERLRKEPAGE